MFKNGRFCGMTDIKTTFRYYVHSDTDAQRIALSQIAIGKTVPIGTETQG
jgi:hypothetical protein